MSSNNTLDITHQQALFAVDMQRAFAAAVSAAQLEMKRRAEEERKKEEIRRKTRERVRKLRQRRREEAMASASRASSDDESVSGSSPNSAGSCSKNAKSGKTSTSCACSSSTNSTCSPQAKKADTTTATSSKKRKLSADNPTAALITPHKPHEDTPDTEHAESNDNCFADDDDDDIGMHCFDDDHVNVEEEDVTSKPAASLATSSSHVKEQNMDSKPAASSPPIANETEVQSDEGKVGFVLIPLKDPADIPLFASTTQYVYWPALIYSSFEAFVSTFPVEKETRQLYAEIVGEWPRHEAGEIALWSQQGIITPNDNTKSRRTHPIKVAVLLGSEVPPSGTRSYPIHPKDITIVRGGQPHKSHIPFTAARVDRLSESPGYANYTKFLKAADMAKQYKFSKDTTRTKMLASLKMR